MDTDNGRKVRALAIVAQAGTIERTDPRHYRVKSQSGNGWYQVIKEGGEWKCECPDFLTRGVVCKHCFAVNCSITLRDRALSQNFFGPIQLPDPGSITCKRCGGSDVVKHSVRRNVRAPPAQRYSCKSCGHRFVIDEGFLKMKSDGKIVALALDLFFKKVTFREIADTLEQLYGVRVAHSTVIRWHQKYVKIAKEFVDGLKPDLSGILHVDEMMIHVRNTQPIKLGNKYSQQEGNYSWLWNLADHDTRFLLASRVSKRRNVEDARAVFKDAKKLMSRRPLAVVHDGLHTYNEAFKDEFYTNYGPRIQNIRSVGQRDDGLNQMIERVNNTIRDKEKTTRGFDHDETAQGQADGIRVNYNFVRRHMGLDGKTPAQAAGLDLGLEGIRWKSLIEKATKSRSGTRP